ncbi:unnamed protein product, partial [Rotaria sp. Silwood2]
DLLSSSSTRIVLLWVESNYTPLVLQHALDCGVLGPHFTWILRSNIPLEFFNRTSYPNLIGMLSIESVAGNVVSAPINTSLLKAAYQIWQQYELETFPGPMKVNYYALFAFDATWTLIQSLQKLCSSHTNQRWTSRGATPSLIVQQGKTPSLHLITIVVLTLRQALQTHTSLIEYRKKYEINSSSTTEDVSENEEECLEEAEGNCL